MHNFQRRILVNADTHIFSYRRRYWQPLNAASSVHPTTTPILRYPSAKGASYPLHCSNEDGSFPLWAAHLLRGILKIVRIENGQLVRDLAVGDLNSGIRQVAEGRVERSLDHVDAE